LPGPSLLSFGYRDARDFLYEDELMAFETRGVARAALAKVQQVQTGASEEDALAWISAMRAQDRFVEDIWGGGS
jgi:sulfite reductase alpha subunit-like flavoprotein